MRLFSFFHRSIFRQIITIYLILAISSAIFCLSLIYNVIYKNLTDFWLNDNINFVKTLSNAVSYPLLIEDAKTLKDLINIYRNNPSINNIVVYNSKGDIIYKIFDDQTLINSFNFNYFLDRLKQNNYNVIYEAEAKILYNLIYVENIDYIYIESYKDEKILDQSMKILGLIQVRLDDTKIKNEINKTMIKIIFIIILGVCIVIIILFFMTKRFLRPIYLLIDSTKKVSKGEFNSKIDLSLKGELGDLLTHYNLMLDALQDFHIKLQLERNLLAKILNAMDEIVIMIDNQNKIEFINPTFFQEFNIKTDKEKEEIINEIISPINNTSLDQIHIYNLKVIEKQIKEKLFKIKYIPIIDENNKISILIIGTNITNERQLEDERLKIQKLESIAILAGGIAHDFNNILTAILGNISLTRYLLKGNEKLEERLKNAEIACERGQNLAKQLLAFAKGGQPVKKPVSIIDIVKEAINLSLSGKKSSCELHIHDKIPLIEADPNQLFQVFQNIIINADQAMPDGGKIIIEIATTNVTPNKNLSCLPGNYVVIKITDHGIGIPKENLNKIFDPFFSTKEKGSGLGLATAYSIIKRHKGCISVESEVGKGTTFSVYLPIPETKLNESYDTTSSQSVSKDLKRLRILIMDDEEPVRDVLKNMLEHLGHECIEAKNGDETLNIYNSYLKSNKPIDLVIMDLTIVGGMGGKEAIKKLLSIDENAKAIVCSGYSDDPIMSNYKEYGFLAALPKPVKLEDLQKVLTSIFGGKYD